MEISCQPCLTAFPELGELASQLRCGICYEIMKTPMITPCSHSYCSLCIRTSISFKQTCPACPAVVRDDSLKNNLALHNCIAPFLSLQKKIHELCETGEFKNLKNLAEPKISSELNASPERQLQIDPARHADTQQSGGSTDSTGSKFQAQAKKHSVILHSNENKVATESKFQAKAKHIAEWIQSPKKIPATDRNHSAAIKPDIEPQNSCAGRLPAVFFTSPKSSSRLQNDGPSSSTQNNNLNRVPCPVCSVQIPERNINLHLDKCLSSQEDLTSPSPSPSPSPSKPEVPKREPLKKMVYHMMAEKEVRKKLKDYGLSSKGDRSQLVSRLQKYTVLYNSECDSLQPRSVAEIKRQLEKEEEALSKVGQPLLKAVRLPKTADSNEIEELNQQYMNEHKSAFDDLIRQIRQRGTKKKEELPRNELSTPKRTKFFDQMRAMEDDSSPEVTRDGLCAKRSRISDDDSVGMSDSLPSSKAAKTDIEEDEDNDFVASKHAKTPRRNRIYDGDDFFSRQASDHSKTTAVPKRNASEYKAIKPNGTRQSTIVSQTLNSSGLSAFDEDDEQSPNHAVFRMLESPVLNRHVTIQNDAKPLGKRTRRECDQDAAKQPAPNTRRQTRQKIEEPKAAQPTRRKAKRKDAPVRTVSRTPSLSPSHFEGFNESGSANERGRSETPELAFESQNSCKSLLSSQTEAKSRSDQRNLPLSQLADLLAPSGDSSNFIG